MDRIDLTLLRALADNGRAPFTELAELVGLSAPSTADRVRRLESDGTIRGYSATLEPAAIGLDLTAFIAVTLAGPADRADFLAAVAAIPDVVECHHVAGDDDYLLKTRCAGTAGLERLIGERLKSLPGVARTRSTIVLSSPVERPLAPEPPTR
jgi:Lrp/AsnC family leucine-responsive transcriptional regulator